MLIKSNFLIRHRKVVSILLLVIILGVGTGVIFKINSRRVLAKENVTPTIVENYAEAQNGSIYLSITSSGAIESSSTKNIASEVSAKVKKVNVKVGDKVSKGDVLFELDSTDLDTQIRNKQKSITSYQKQISSYEKNISNYEKNITDYEKNISEYNEDINNLYVYSNVAGYVQNLKVVKGDSVNKNAVIFDVIKDTNYILNVQFPYFEHSPINIGDKVSMVILDSFGVIEGTISKVSDLKSQSQYGGQLQEVTISIINPGYTLEGVNVGEINVTTQNGTTIYAENTSTVKCQDTESFKVSSAGTVNEVLVNDGSYVNVGDLVIVMENDDLADKIIDANDSIENVKSNIIDTQSNIKEAQSSISDVYQDIADLKEDYSFYTITAPIDGVVTSVAVSEGDYVRAESSIAKIVNTDLLQFEISVDELDILKLEVGQEAKITIDALEDTELRPIIGNVTEIGLEGYNMNSVTSYPVLIQFAGKEEIKMGMNCSVEIIVDSAEDVLTVPVEAVNTRRGKYYVTLENGEEREVEIGLYDDEKIEIKSGLTNGEKVKLPSQVVATAQTQTDEKVQEGSFNLFGGMGGGAMPTGGMPQGGGNFGGGNRSSNMGGNRQSGAQGNRGGF